MAKFMFLQRGACESRARMSPEEMQAGMQAWMDWVQRGTADGWLVDPGSPLSDKGAVVNADQSVIDGPFMESKELVGGYTIVEAADLAAACELARQTITIAGGGRIEVRQITSPGK